MSPVEIVVSVCIIAVPVVFWTAVDVGLFDTDDVK